LKRTFVGRERELAALQAALEHAVSGRGAFIRVLGEPGVGKTRLVDQLVERAFDNGLAVGWARSWKGGPPFGVVTELVRSAFRDREALARALAGEGAAAARLLPELVAESAVHAPPSRDTTISALLAIFEALGPSLLVIDDLHGIDLDSLAFVQRLAPRLRMTPCLLVATQRSVATGATAALAADLADLARTAETLDLEGLGVDAVGALMAEVTEQSVDPRLAEAVHRATHGNALFLDGVLRAAVRDGSFEAGTLRFPVDVRQAILARAEAAGPDAIDVLRSAALMTRPFSLPFVRTLFSATAEQAVLGIDRALEESLLIRADRGRFAFRHGLVAEALAAATSEVERARRHSQIADAIVALEGEAASRSELAYHRCEAVPFAGEAAALAACGEAVAEAGRLAAYEEAAGQLRKMREILELYRPSNRSAWLEVTLDLGRQLLLAGRRADARAELFAAARVAESLGNVSRLGDAALAAADTGEFGAFDAEKLGLLEKARAQAARTTPLRLRLTARLAAELWVDRASQARRRELSLEAMAGARELADPGLLRLALDARFHALWGPSSFSERLAIADELAQLADAGTDVDETLASHRRKLLVAIETGDMAAFSVTLDRFAALAALLKRPAVDETVAQRRFMLTLVRGQFDQASALADEIFERGRAVQNPQTEMGNRFMRSELALHARDPAVLRGLIEGLAADADRLPHLHFIRARTAQVAAIGGEAEVAHRHLSLYLAAIAPGLNEDIVTLAGLSFAAQAAARIGALDAARTLHGLLAPYTGMVASIGATICVGAVSHFLGLLEQALGDLDAAVGSFEDALTRHRAMASPPFERETAEALATTLELRDHAGDRDRAHRLSPPLPAPSPPLKVAPPVVAAHELAASLSRSDAGVWQLVWDGRLSSIGSAKGLELIAHLIRNEGQQVHVLDLVGAGELRSATGQDDGPVLDAAAKQAYRERVEHLRGAEAEADERGDGRSSARARAEREAIEDELARGLGLGGRDRRTGTAERARVAVAKSIRRALDAIGRSEAACSTHLERSLRTGLSCVYAPDPSSRVKWQF
jgi:hypothetical protein